MNERKEPLLGEEKEELITQLVKGMHEDYQVGIEMQDLPKVGTYGFIFCARRKYKIQTDSDRF